MGELAGRALGYRIRAVVKSDDGQKSANICALAWFELRSTTDDVVRELHRNRYRGADADAIAYYAHEVENNTGVGQVFAYLSHWKPRTPGGGIIGFECVVKAADVFKYLAERRRHLAAELFPNDPMPDPIPEPVSEC